MQIRRNTGGADPRFGAVDAMLPGADHWIDYQLEEQVGFLLRRAHQRASGIFNRHFSAASLSTVQFAALIKIRDEGRVSQNQLGRLINLDSATIMGVINRLADRELIARVPDPEDKRRILLSITPAGLGLVQECLKEALAVSAETLEPLSPSEQAVFLQLLSKLL